MGQLTEDEQITFSVREISRMIFKHPYMIFCKGSSQLVIRSFDRVNETLLYELPKNEIFMSFLDIDSSYYFSENQDHDVKYVDVIEGQRDKYELAKGSHSLYFGFLTQGNKCVSLHVLRFFPYSREAGFIVEKYVYNTRFRKNDFPLKEII